MNSLTPFELSAIGLEIAHGISERGFHVLSVEQFERLCPEDASPQRFEQIERFAARHGWEVALKNRASSALFRRQETKARIEAIWRRGLKLGRTECRGFAEGVAR